MIDLLSLKDGLLLPRSLSAILCGPFGSPDVLKLGGLVAAGFLRPSGGDHRVEANNKHASKFETAMVVVSRGPKAGASWADRRPR